MFSVVIPSYNHERYLSEAILSAASEQLVSEILVADDGSSDDSIDIIERLASIHGDKVKNLTRYPVQNIGAHAMLNMLVSRARCSWVAVLNSDDRFVAGRFSALRNRLRLSQVEFCFGNIAIMDSDGAVIGRKRAFHDPQFAFPRGEETIGTGTRGLLKRLFCQNYIATTSNMVFTKRLWEAVGGFREYRYAHDWDFAMRAMILGEAAYLPEYICCYRVHATNTIKESRSKQDEEVRRIFSSVKDDFGPEIFEEMRRYLAANEYL